MLFEQDAALYLSSLTVFMPDYAKSRCVHVAERPHHALSFRLSGSKSVEANGKSVISAPDTVLFVPAGLAYDTTVYESGSMYVIHFTAESDTPLSHGVFSPSNPLLYRNLFAEMLAAFRPGKEHDFRCFSLFYHLLAEIRSEERASASFMPQRIRTAKSFIDRHFGEEGLSVASLAKDAGVSEVYFRKEFAKYCGVSPGAYISSVRIENAKTLLGTGYYTVTETAMRCGFDSVSYFSARFKEAVGVPPKQYKA